jgi:hypothetical protein
MKLVDYLENEIGYFKTPIPKELKPAVVYIGGFSPFHNSHYKQYKKIKAAFPNTAVFVLYKKANDKRGKEFPQNLKKEIIQSYGIKNVKELIGSSFSMKSISDAIGKEYNIIITAIGQKDSEQSRGKGQKVVIKKESDIKKELDKAGSLVKMEFIIPAIEKSDDVSGTEIRSAIKEKNKDFLKKFLNDKAFSTIEKQMLGEANEIRIKHVDDLIWDKNPKESLKEIEDDLLSFFDGTKNIAFKTDGRPAIVFGKKDGKFFLSIKRSIELKNPNVFFSTKEIDTSDKTNDSLRNLLKYLWPYLEAMTKSGMWIAELLYTPTQSPGKKEIKNNVISFTPNVVKYDVDSSYPHYDWIKKSKIGIVVTGSFTWNGTTVNKNYNTDPEKQSGLKKTNDVFWMGPKIEKHSNDETSKVIKNRIAGLKQIANGISDESFAEIKKMNFLEFLNKRMREGKISRIVGFSKGLIDEYINFIESKYKTEKKISEVKDFISKNNKEIRSILVIYQAVNDLKDSVYRKIKSGLPSSEGEGFVVSDGSGTKKIVPKIGFTNKNFTSRAAK